PAVPGPTSEIVVQPFDERSGKRSVGVADQPFKLGLEPAEIAFLIECRGAGQRVELAVKRPENCPRAIAAVEQVKEIPPNLAAAAVQRDRIAADPVCPLLVLGTVVKNTRPAVSIVGEKVLMRYRGELVGREDGLLVLVDDLDRKALTLRDGAR